MNIKIERINDALVEEISYIINRKVKNKGINFVTITDVHVNSDLSQAKVYYTVLDDTKKEETQKALESASGFIRHELRDRIEIRQIPELKFIYDTSIEYGKHIDNIIENLKD